MIIILFFYRCNFHVFLHLCSEIYKHKTTKLKITKRRMSLQHVPVHHSESMEEITEDPFDDDIESTFPPQRYCATYFPRPAPAIKLRRESSMERARLYRELVGHEPYRSPPTRVHPARNDFRVMLSVKHYMPEEITLKVDGIYL